MDDSKKDSALDSAAKMVLQPKTKAERAMEIGTGLAITAAGIGGMVYCAKKVREYSPRQRVHTSSNKQGGYDVEVLDDANPDANPAKATLVALGMIASTVTAGVGTGKTIHAALEPDKWMTQAEVDALKACEKAKKKIG